MFSAVNASTVTDTLNGRANNNGQSTDKSLVTYMYCLHTFTAEQTKWLGTSGVGVNSKQQAHHRRQASAK